MAMNRFGICAAILALGISATAATAEPFSQQETDYVYAVVSAIAIETQCPGLELSKEGLQRFADQNGADEHKMGAAIWAAIGAKSSSHDYDRAALIPEVTRAVSVAIVNLSAEKDSDPKHWCKNNADILMKIGILQAK